MEIKIPYGSGEMTAELPAHRVRAILKTREPDGEPYRSPDRQRRIVREAMRNPCGGKPLAELARGKAAAVILSSDHTRPAPSRITMPLLLEELRRGNPQIRITILVATGLHRAPTKEELIEKYGEEIAARERIRIHDCRDAAGLTRVGTLPSGGKLELNSLALSADLLLAEGFIEPHFFAGFSGGRKSVLPGVAGYDCVVANHCAEFIAHKNADYGILAGNPIHEDMLFAARKAGLAFILNVILNEDKNIVAAVAGDMEEAHRRGCGLLRQTAECEKVTAPIVLTSNGGYPLDQNLYQAAKSAATAAKCCDEGGVIILLSECRDGIGGEAYYQDFAAGKGPAALLAEIGQRSRGETRPDQWQSQILARVLAKHKLIVISSLPDEALEQMGIGCAKSIAAALRDAERFLGDREAPVVVIPNGISVLVKDSGKREDEQCGIR